MKTIGSDVLFDKIDKYIGDFAGFLGNLGSGSSELSITVPQVIATLVVVVVGYMYFSYIVSYYTVRKEYRTLLRQEEKCLEVLRTPFSKAQFEFHLQELEKVREKIAYHECSGYEYDEYEEFEEAVNSAEDFVSDVSDSVNSLDSEVTSDSKSKYSRWN